MYYQDNDRRLFPRFDIACFAGIKMSNSQVSVCALCHDSSVNGIGLMVDTKLAPRQTLGLILQFPGAATVNSLARVIWSEQNDDGKWWTGVEFTHIDTAKLKQWIVTQA